MRPMTCPRRTSRISHAYTPHESITIEVDERGSTSEKIVERELERSMRAQNRATGRMDRENHEKHFEAAEASYAVANNSMGLDKSSEQIHFDDIECVNDIQYQA